MRDAGLPITLIVVGSAWLLWYFRLFPDIDWIIAAGLVLGGILKAPKFVTGYFSLEADVALIHGEIDSRSNNTTSVLRRNRVWVEKGIMDFHAILAVPKSENHPHPKFAHCRRSRVLLKQIKKNSSYRCGAGSERQPRLSCYRRERPKTGWRFCKMRCAKLSRIRSS
ncbi:MAG: hypothetical protein ACREP3_15970, partial [Candidatus Binatia bacterium]